MSIFLWDDILRFFVFIFISDTISSGIDLLIILLVNFKVASLISLATDSHLSSDYLRLEDKRWFSLEVSVLVTLSLDGLYFGD